MLKKILIGLAIVLALGLAASGYEAWSFYQAAQGIITPHVVGTPCPIQTATPGTYTRLPKILPWTNQQASTRPGRGRMTACVNSPNELPTLNGTKRVNILVLGTDNDCKKIALLSQTIFVVTIDPVHKRVGMLSIPRDSLVPIPGSVPGDQFTYHKIDEAMSYGASASGSLDFNKQFLNGVRYAWSTVEQNFGIKLDYYAWVGLNGFVRAIDTLKGVDVNAMHPMVDDTYPGDVLGADCYGYSRVYIPPGPQFMNGSLALQYVRSRHADFIGDYGRGARQLQMLTALRPKIDSLGLTDFLTVKALFDNLKGFVRTDVGLDQVGGMVDFAKRINLNKVHKLVLRPPYYSTPGTATTQSGTQDVVFLNWAHVLPAVRRLFAPITTRRHQVTPPAMVSSQQAARYLSRISGAVVTPPNRGTRRFTGSLRGAIYFVAGGNVWRYSSGGARQLTHTTAIDSASITSNGHKLVYYRRWSQNNADVWVKNMVTGRTTQLTQSRQGDGNIAGAVGCVSYPLCGYVWNVNPVISPNGRTILYQSDAFKLVTYPSLTFNPDCVIGGTADTQGGIDPALYGYSVRTRTTAQLSASCNGAGGDADGRFNPANPNQVVYTEYYYLPNSAIASRLVVLNLVSNTRKRLTPFRGRNMQAVWSPNGRHMAWLGSSDQSTTLYEAAYSSNRLRRSTSQVIDTGLISQPEFSPDGKYLVYFKLVGGGFEVWIVNLHNERPAGQPMPLFTKSAITASAPLVWIK